MKDVLLLLITIAVLLMATELTYLSWSFFKLEVSLQKAFPSSQVQPTKSNNPFEFFIK